MIVSQLIVYKQCSLQDKASILKQLKQSQLTLSVLKAAINSSPKHTPCLQTKSHAMLSQLPT